jgi:hypothetical protein
VPVPSEDRFVAVVDGKCESKFVKDFNSLKIGNSEPYLLINSAPIPSISRRHSRDPGFISIPRSLVAPSRFRDAKMEFDNAAKFRDFMAISCPN